MSDRSAQSETLEYRSPLSTLARVWIGVGVALWSVALALTTTPPLTDLATLAWTGLAAVVLVAMVFSLSERLRNWPTYTVYVAITLALGGWAALMFRDDRWSVLTFALYSMCFAKGREVGVVLAAIVGGIWLAAEIAGEAPTMALLIPFATFAVGAVVSVMIYRVSDDNQAQAALIAELRDKRAELAASERERATLAERARFAGEVHDTLAQGFTSIVLLSRATQRSRDWNAGLARIEATADENLTAARRLVAAMGPAELDRSSLIEALERQLEALDPGTETSFEVSGTPVGLATPVEVALLRMAQEALRNVRIHAGASVVHITLTYVGSMVVLDVADDGIGFSVDVVSDRGKLTGGQGLAGLRRRAESLGGCFEVEAGLDGGTVVSMQLPVTAS